MFELARSRIWLGLGAWVRSPLLVRMHAFVRRNLAVPRSVVADHRSEVADRPQCVHRSCTEHDMCTITQTNARATATMVLRDAMFELSPLSQAGFFLFVFRRLSLRSRTRTD